ncbi:MAG: HAD-IB family phosphatase [Synergistaceae bacterium]|jgi:glycerol-3-phosphate dehydrogenase (NAD+)|nr:HAD-IB family phosphatase [Synergistaceae bacterium]
MKMDKNPDTARRNSFIFDFDSTIVAVETLDTLIRRNLSGEEGRRIDDITRLAMNGEMDFSDSLAARLRLGRVRREDFARMAGEIMNFLTPGMEGVLKFLTRKGQALFIVSGGFVEIIRPVAQFFDIPDDHCFANEYIADAGGRVVGVRDGPPAREGGKSEIVRRLREQNRLPGVVVMLGDGMSDYRVYADGLADLFIGCGFNVARPNVKARSPIFVESAAALLALLSGPAQAR